MDKKEILKELIDHLYAFYEEKQGVEDYSTDDFLGYLNTRSGRENIGIRKIGGDQTQWIKPDYRNARSDISILLVLMYRYARGYIKKALKDSAVHTADEFAYLITLMTCESLTKTELIKKQVMEKTTGMEVVKRLLQGGFMREFDDQEDKRSVRVAITEKGRNEIVSILPAMSFVSGIVVGNLSEEETNTLAYLLKKLDYFHNDIFMNKRDTLLRDIINHPED